LVDGSLNVKVMSAVWFARKLEALLLIAIVGGVMLGIWFGEEDLSTA
jgi:hypothetical protein